MNLSGENITKSYGGKAILRDCSLSVDSGQCLLLRGPSGGGKSTLLRILAMLETADRGQIRHAEKTWDAARIASSSPYPFLTLVFQQLFLWPNLTIAQNISMVLSHRPDGALPAASGEMLERFGIHHILKQHPHECSLGERQRVAIARALLSDARFLLLDEPSSALDRVNLGILMQELRSALDQDRGVLLVTHDDRGFHSIADQCFELENGVLQRL